MTTVAWDGKTLAADRKASLGAMIFDDTKLLAPCSDTVIASAGRAEFLHLVCKWIAGGSKRDEIPKPQEDDEWIGIMVVCGVPYLLESRLVPQPILGPIAIGSGRSFALAAMDFGRDAVAAIEYTATRDAYTGLGVDSATWDFGAAEFNTSSKRST